MRDWALEILSWGCVRTCLKLLLRNDKGLKMPLHVFDKIEVFFNCKSEMPIAFMLRLEFIGRFG